MDTKSTEVSRTAFELTMPYLNHYDDVIMGTMASQITSLTIVYSTVYSGADQRNHQSSASLAFVQVNSPHKWPVMRKMFSFDDVIMYIWIETKWRRFYRHFQMHFVNNCFKLSIHISLQFVPGGPIDDKLALLQITARLWAGDKPLSAPMNDLVHWRIYSSPGVTV